MLRTKRRVIGGVIVAFWAVMMTTLLYREVLLPRWNAANRIPLPFQQQDIWMGVFLGEDERIGFVNSTMTPNIRDGEEGVGLSLTARFEMAMFGRPTNLQINGTAWRSKNEGLRDFEIGIRSGEQEMKISGVVEENELIANVHTAGEDLPFRFPVGNDLLLSMGMDTPGLSVPLLKDGEEVYVDTFDPTTMSTGRARIVYVGKETIEISGTLYECTIIETTIGGVKSRAWISENEEVIKATTPFGFTLKRITPQEALRPRPEAEIRGNAVAALAIRPTGKRPLRGATHMRVRFSGITADRLPPESASQVREGELYVFRQLPAPTIEDTIPDAVRQEGLGSDPFIQSDHPTIVAQAKKIAREGTAWEKALALYEWVYTELDKEPAISVPSALDVLRTRQGDCNEHTVLFTALARAVEVPTRIAIGVVWSADLGGFGYHAWPEVYVGKQWIPMDPTLGEPIADATHIALLYGSIERWAQLVSYIGQLEIEVIDVE